MPDGVTCWAYLCVSHLGLPFVSLPSSERAHAGRPLNPRAAAVNPSSAKTTVSTGFSQP